MCMCARLLLLAALPALAGRAGGEVVSARASAEGTGGAGPAFAPRQRLAAVAAAGQDAALECRVLRLGDKAVSWVRSRDLQILTHAGSVFTADARVSAAESSGASGGAGSGAGGGAGSGASGGAGGRAGSRHVLHIERLRVSDSGRYECQVNTDPKMSLFFNLTVVDEPVPRVVVAALEPEAVGSAGGAATLACEARYEPPPRRLPLPPLDVRWRRKGDAAAPPLQRSRGGVSLDTERWAARAVSRLTLAELEPADGGEYECAAQGTSATARLVVRHGEEQMEMQRDQSASAAPRGCRPPPWLALSLSLSLSLLSPLAALPV